MALKVEVFHVLIVVFIHVVKYETTIGAGYCYGEGYLNDTSDIPSNCVLFSTWGIRCDLKDYDEMNSHNATKIEIDNILNLVGFQFTKLVIGYTTISDFPETVCQLKQLNFVALGDNRLSNVFPNDCFTGMNELKY